MYCAYYALARDRSRRLFSVAEGSTHVGKSNYIHIYCTLFLKLQRLIHNHVCSFLSLVKVDIQPVRPFGLSDTTELGFGGRSSVRIPINVGPGYFPVEGLYERDIFQDSSTFSGKFLTSQKQYIY